jgi:hypothetical protein
VSERGGFPSCGGSVFGSPLAAYGELYRQFQVRSYSSRSGGDGLPRPMRRPLQRYSMMRCSMPKQILGRSWNVAVASQRSSWAYMQTLTGSRYMRWSSTGNGGNTSRVSSRNMASGPYGYSSHRWCSIKKEWSGIHCRTISVISGSLRSYAMARQLGNRGRAMRAIHSCLCYAANSTTAL